MRSRNPGDPTRALSDQFCIVSNTADMNCAVVSISPMRGWRCCELMGRNRFLHGAVAASPPPARLMA